MLSSPTAQRISFTKVMFVCHVRNFERLSLRRGDLEEENALEAALMVSQITARTPTSEEVTRNEKRKRDFDVGSFDDHLLAVESTPSFEEIFGGTDIPTHAQYRYFLTSQRSC